ncbi:MAG TPA: hypothetical protein VJ941_11160, partial [Gracilimonas sp.]|nr:hypothetical protein [Gracilimonas sp.]
LHLVGIVIKIRLGHGLFDLTFSVFHLFDLFLNRLNVVTDRFGSPVSFIASFSFYAALLFSGKL